MLYKIFYYSASFLNIILCIPAALFKLLFWSGELRLSEAIIFMTKGGFGHTISGTDAARRFFRGKRPVFIIFSGSRRHNSKASVIWPDIRVIFITLNIGFKTPFGPLELPCAGRYKDNFIKVTSYFIKMINASADFYNLWDVYKKLPLPGEMGRCEPKPRYLIEKPHYSPHLWPIAYFKLLRDVPAPKVHLPEKIRKKISSRLNLILPGNISPYERRFCCLYLRSKGGDSKNITERSRAGSDFVDYIPAIKLLNKFNYQVLIVGDVIPDKKRMKEFNGMAANFSALRIPVEYFYLFAATEADIFIGETGGGVWLPGVNGIPSLLINAFPYGTGLPNSWVYYKRLRRKDGTQVSCDALFSDHLYQYHFEELSLENNTDDEIYNAVASFLSDLSSPNNYDPFLNIRKKMSDYSWIKQSGARLSPAWCKTYENR